jgi:hypothetical protein
MPVQNMLDIAKLTGNDRAVGLIEENIKAVPEIGAFAARTIRGTSFKAGRRTAYPSGSFRAAGGGSTLTKSTFAQTLHECFDYGLPLQIPHSIAAAHEDGAEAFLTLEAIGAGIGAMRDMGRQIFYGTASATSGSDEGFQGLKQQTVFGAETAYGDALTINAAGTTAATASSVYFVRMGEQDCQLIFGQGAVLEMPEFMRQMATDSAGKSFMAYVSELQAWAGLAVYSENAVRRIANLTEDSGKGLTTDLLDDAVATFRVGHSPSDMFLSRRSFKQLRKDMSITSVINGKPVYGRRPSEAEAQAELNAAYNVLVHVSDSIGNTDAIEA